MHITTLIISLHGVKSTSVVKFACNAICCFVDIVTLIEQERYTQKRFVCKLTGNYYRSARYTCNIKNYPIHVGMLFPCSCLFYS